MTEPTGLTPKIVAGLHRGLEEANAEAMRARVFWAAVEQAVHRLIRKHAHITGRGCSEQSYPGAVTYDPVAEELRVVEMAYYGEGHHAPAYLKRDGETIESLSFRVPVRWLAMPDEEVAAEIQALHDAAKAKEAARAEAKAAEEARRTKAMRRAMYEELKGEFDGEG